MKKILQFMAISAIPGVGISCIFTGINQIFYPPETAVWAFDPWLIGGGNIFLVAAFLMYKKTDLS